MNLDPISVPEVLTRAADLLEEKGWCQHYPVDMEGRMCAVGAIRAASEGQEQGYFASRVAVKAQQAVEKAIGGDFISRWNDRPERTKDEVIALFRTVASEYV